MGMENINGKTVESIKENINLIKSMERVNILGQMAANIMGNGLIANDMGRER